jgi:hypothetical protein
LYEIFVPNNVNVFTYSNIYILSTNYEVPHCTHPQISLGKASQVKANEVGVACGTHERGEKSVQGFGGKARRKETTWKTKV